MLFNSALYGVFLLAVYAVFWALTPRARPGAPPSVGVLATRRLLRALFLVGASYAFYFYGTYDAALDAAADKAPPLSPLAWSVLCLGIIFVGSTLDFAIGNKLAATQDPRRRKLLLLVSVTYYLGVLALFKYWNFGADTVVDMARVVGVTLRPVHLRLALPFGISFFTFETMSYTIDVYRREIQPARRYLDYLLFVAFFPHLVAGPIVRPHTMLPQFEREPVATDDTKARGMFLIATGLAKKLVIGDTLAVNLVGRVFDNPERYSSLEGLVAVYAYAIQIYCDFSGYTDVAIGSALLFGYELPLNFNAPYTSRDLQEFWRRWHISLSTWLRDYLYISLGGSRGSAWKTYRNLMLTMVLGGLWHGASWNFVIWGALHGGALAVNRAWQRAREARLASLGVGPATLATRDAAPLWRQALAVLATFHFVCVAWIFFRAQTFAQAKLLLLRTVGVREVMDPVTTELKTVLSFTLTTPNLSAKVLLALALGFVTHFLPRRAYEGAYEAFRRSPAVLQGVMLAVVAYALHLAAGAKSEPFVYGQF
ncbi:MAG: MBOAT family protein [Myxococcales bacterium]|jgi:D-alanyl-lipoteichoic acid acyltransferase DltB (MBOAT superfamily)|nr:MBOAT family protein [Myxococcales bacterium]HQY60596.1 MBOAT family O-acyltransferase [Polyangiaceae bacterium]